MRDPEQLTVTDRPHWYQRTRLWVVVAVAALPVAFGLSILFEPSSFFFSVVIGVTAALAPAGLWMGALVTRSGLVRSILSLSTVLLIALSARAVWVYLDNLAYASQEACWLIDGDADLCAFGEDGGLDALRRNAWIMFAGLWVAPLFVLYGLRKRLRPDDLEYRRWTVHLAEAGGVLLLVVGGFYLVLAALVAINGELGSDGVIWAILFGGVPTLLGTLLVRWGRKRTQSPEKTPS